MKNPVESIADLAQRLAEMGRSARQNIDQIRADIAAAQVDLAQVEAAPVDDAEVARRAELVVGYAAGAARAKGVFAEFAKRGFNENAAWSGVEDLPALSLLAITRPAELAAAIVAEAKSATRDFSTRGPMTSKRRDDEATNLRQRIDALHRREEAAVRALADAGIVVERRRGAPDLSGTDSAALRAEA